MALWSPSQVTTEAWFDAKDPSTITESSGNVSQWDDKSGNGNHAVQATGAAQPYYSTDEIQFSSIEYMSAPDVLPTGSGARHIFAVLNGNTSGVTVGFLSQEVVTWTNYTSLRITREPAIRYYGITTYTDSAFDSGSHFISVNYESAAAARDIDYFVDGTQQTYDSGSAGALNSDGTDLYIGANAINYLDKTAVVNFNEIVVITNRTMSSSERQKIEGYFAHKWGLTGSLDPSHPYKSAAPTRSAPGFPAVEKYYKTLLQGSGL